MNNHNAPQTDATSANELEKSAGPNGQGQGGKSKQIHDSGYEFPGLENSMTEMGAPQDPATLVKLAKDNCKKFINVNDEWLLGMMSLAKVLRDDLWATAGGTNGNRYETKAAYIKGELNKDDKRVYKQLRHLNAYLVIKSESSLPLPETFAQLNALSAIKDAAEMRKIWKSLTSEGGLPTEEEINKKKGSGATHHVTQAALHSLYITLRGTYNQAQAGDIEKVKKGCAAGLRKMEPMISNKKKLVQRNCEEGQRGDNDAGGGKGGSVDEPSGNDGDDCDRGVTGGDEATRADESTIWNRFHREGNKLTFTFPDLASAQKNLTAVSPQGFRLVPAGKAWALECEVSASSVADKIVAHLKEKGLK